MPPSHTHFLAFVTCGALGAFAQTLPASTAGADTPLELERLTVQADRLAIPSSQTSARVDVLSAATLAPFAVKDTADALARVPNVTVQRYGSVNGEAGLKLKL